jgi:hypothetical protein
MEARVALQVTVQLPDTIMMRPEEEVTRVVANRSFGLANDLPGP